MKVHTISRLFIMLVLLALGLTPALSFAEGPGPGPAYEVRFTGVIDTVPAADGEPWVVAGHTVNVDAETEIRLTTGSAAIGMWAAVIADQDAEGTLVATHIAVMPPEIRLKGPIASIPDGRVGTWVIAGQSITATDETRYNERGGPLTVGGWAEVYMLEDPAGTLTALRIRSIEFQEEVEVYGVIQVFAAGAWELSTIPLTVTEETMTTAVPQAGLLAHAAALLQEDGSLLARTIRIFWQEPGGLHQAVQFRGTVESLPESGLTGRWVVSGRAVDVTDTTSIIQAKGTVEVGSVVHIVGWETGDALEAFQITVLIGNWRGFAFHFEGAIEALPQDGLAGNWTIAGQQVQVTQQTRITGAEHAKLGAPVEVGGVQRQEGVRVATWLRIRDASGPGPGPTMTPEPPKESPATPCPSRTPGNPGIADR